MPLVTAWSERTRTDGSQIEVEPDSCFPSLKTGTQRQQGVQSGQIVRRLMPVECLRLQGFPDNHLDLDPPLSDSAKYRLIGNAVTVNVAAWVGKRLHECKDKP